MNNPSNSPPIPRILFPKLDQSVVDDCINQADGDIAKVAELLAMSVGPLNYDDEDELLESSGDGRTSESSEDKCEIEGGIECQPLPPSINEKWEGLKQKLTTEELQVIEDVFRLRLHTMTEALAQDLFSK